MPHRGPLTDADYVVEDRGHTTPCWIKHGHRRWNGYVYVRVRGRQTAAHRAMYEQVVGPIPAGLELDHLCRVPACINPDHLEPVTRLVNVRRSRLTRLTDEQVRAIRADSRPQVTIAREHGIHPSYVSQIKSMKYRTVEV